jgi:high-affinity iron transporter
MLLNSVILVLQETLEAALLVSVLLVISNQQWNRVAWVAIGFSGGLVLSFLYASNMLEISEWFDYVGQEIVNASLQILTTLLVVVCTWALFKSRQIEARVGPAQKNRFTSLFIFCAAAAVALVITREGSETLTYLSGFFGQKEYFQTVITGSSIGFSIGLSLGILLYYGLMSLPGNWRLDASVILLAIFAGNMLSQAVLQLTQADWISSTQAFWDTSDWVPESSTLGKSLYALVGYEATPSAAQLIASILGMVLVLASGAAGKYSKNNDPTTIQVP